MRWTVLLTVVGVLLTTATGQSRDQPLSEGHIQPQESEIHDLHREKRDVVADEVFFSGDGEDDAPTEQPMGRAFRRPRPPPRAATAMVTFGHFKRCDSRRPVRIKNYQAGEIISPSDTRGFYPPASRCRWLITAPRRYTIHIDIVLLDIKSNFYCWNHFLRLYDGPNERSKLLGSYCGNSAPNNVINSSKNHVLVQFHSGSEVGLEYRGFKLEFRLHASAAIRRAPPCPRFPVRLTDKQGQITSPGYLRSNYPRKLNCQWQITVQQNCTVVLTFEDFALEDSEGCTEDHLRIQDGLDKNLNRVVDFCGERRLLAITSTSNEVLLQFTSNRNTTRRERGFSIKYTTSCPSPWAFRRPGWLPACGISEVVEQPCPGGRVVGGQKVCTPHAYPWMVQMKVYFPRTKSYAHFCGAVLVDTKFVLTARHCMSYRDITGGWVNLMQSLPHIKLITGEHNLNHHEGSEGTHSVLRAIPYYPYYNATHRNDLVLLKIDPPVQIGRDAMPICLPMEPYTPGVHHLVTGWGRVNVPGSGGPAYLPEMRKASLPAIDKLRCNRPDIYDGRITAGMFCAGYAEGGKDACQGDSGGPLFRYVRNRGAWYLFGLVSWGFDCAKPNKPGVYTDVYYYSLWIRQQIFDN